MEPRGKVSEVSEPTKGPIQEPCRKPRIVTRVPMGLVSRYKALPPSSSQNSSLFRLFILTYTLLIFNLI
jgi:hypothetical protein